MPTLEFSTLDERLLTTEEIKQQLAQWKVESEQRHASEDDDTQPLSKAEIAQKLFENRCLNLLRDTQMKAGYFCSTAEYKDAEQILISTVGMDIADEVRSTFFCTYANLFI